MTCVSNIPVRVMHIATILNHIIPTQHQNQDCYKNHLDITTSATKSITANTTTIKKLLTNPYYFQCRAFYQLGYSSYLLNPITTYQFKCHQQLTSPLIHCHQASLLALILVKVFYLSTLWLLTKIPGREVQFHPNHTYFFYPTNL